MIVRVSSPSLSLRETLRIVLTDSSDPILHADPVGGSLDLFQIEHPLLLPPNLLTSNIPEGYRWMRCCCCLLGNDVLLRDHLRMQSCFGNLGSFHVGDARILHRYDLVVQ